MSKRVDVFFYGSYINLSVLAEVDLRPSRVEVARLHGWRFSINPLARIDPDGVASAWGIVADASHAELERLYTEHARGALGGTYLPEAVLVEMAQGGWRSALTYVQSHMAPAPPASEYVDRIASAARRLGFPDMYISHIESFRNPECADG